MSEITNYDNLLCITLTMFFAMGVTMCSIAGVLLTKMHTSEANEENEENAENEENEEGDDTDNSSDEVESDEFTSEYDTFNTPD